MNTEKLPETLREAVIYFADEERAHAFFVAMRWPSGVRCALCNSENVGKLVVSTVSKEGRTLKSGKVIEPYTITRRVWNCKACKKQFTAKVGSIFCDSPLPLSKWLPALWLVVNAKNGVSSCELARSLGITQKSAWHMGHRIRESIQRGGGIVNLNGVVEVDESWIGGSARNMHKHKKAKVMKGVQNTALTPVMGLLERGTRERCSRVRMQIIPNTSRKELHGHVRKYVLKGTEVHTDSLKSYIGLGDDYTHKVVDHAVAYVQDGVHTNGLENYWSLLKRTIKGTYVHCAPFHLFRYLDEQSFRFNERKGDDQSRFLEAVKTAKDRRLTWRNLTGKSERKTI